MFRPTDKRIADYLERRAATLEGALKPGDMDPAHCIQSRASQLRLEAANIRNGDWRKG